MFVMRVLVLSLSLLVATEVIEPTWEVFALLIVIGGMTVHDAYGVGFLVAAAIALVQGPEVSQPILVIAAVLAGLSALEPSRNLRRTGVRVGEGFGLRAMVLVLSVLLAAEVLEPTWEIFAFLVVAASISIRDIYGIGYLVAASIALAQAPAPTEPVLIGGVVLAGLSALRPSRISGLRWPWRGSRGDAHASWTWIDPPARGLRLRPGAGSRLRRWANGGEP